MKKAGLLPPENKALSFDLHSSEIDNISDLKPKKSETFHQLRLQDLGELRDRFELKDGSTVNHHIGNVVSCKLNPVVDGVHP